MLPEFVKGLEETFFMVFFSGLFSCLIGLPLALLWVITAEKHLAPNRIIHRTLSFFLKTALTIPYLIVMIALVPLCDYLFGETANHLSVILPLTLTGIPICASQAYTALSKVPHNLIEFGLSMGVSAWQIIAKIILPESLSDLIKGFTTTINHLLGYSIIAGALGTPGLGHLALEMGSYPDFQWGYVLAIGFIVVLLFKIIEIFGNYLAEGRLKSS